MQIRYFHKAFIDSAHSLIHEFRNDSSNTLLLLGAHYIFEQGLVYEDIVKGYDKVIIYNQESYTWLSGLGWLDRYIPLLKQADEVWDYDEGNIQPFRQFGISPRPHVLKPYMNWGMYAPVGKDIDILSYGSLTPRREALIRFLQEKYNVVHLDNVFGSELDDYILRSRVLLNIHSGVAGMNQEQARMVKWLGAPCKIISERSMHNYLDVPEMDYWELFCL